MENINYSDRILRDLDCLAKKQGIVMRQSFKLGVKTSKDKVEYANKWEKQSSIFTEKEKEALGALLSPEDFITVEGEKTPTSIISKLARRVRHDGATNYSIPQMPDLIRTTAIIESHAHTPHFLNLLKNYFPDLKGNRPDFPMRGYKGTHTNYVMDGLAADTQLVSPLQGMVDDFTHDLYDVIRELPPGSPDRIQLELLSKRIYDMLFESSGFLDNDLIIRSMILDYGRNHPQINPTLLKKMRVQPFKEKKGKISFDIPRLIDQAREAREFSVGKQRLLTKQNKDLFTYYNKQRRQGQIPAGDEVSLTKRQWLIHSRFEKSLGSYKSKLNAYAPGASEDFVRRNYGDIIRNIESKDIIPWLDKQK